MSSITRIFIYKQDEADGFRTDDVAEPPRELLVEDVIGGETKIVVTEAGEDSTIIIPNEVWLEITGRGS